MRVARALAAIAVLVGVGVACHATPERAPFPRIDVAALTYPQRQVVDVVRAQYDEPRPGTFYAEGVDEPWCADFVSWVMERAGQPLENPNSGSWRIPGVYTLQEFYQAQGRFEPPEFSPRTGDVVLYADSSDFGLHANIVLAADGPTLTTVGGNEPGGIRVHTFDVGPDTGLLGYGRLT